MISKILLKNIKIYAYHGVLEEETKIGNYFILNLEISTDLWKAAESDNLSHTINYASINQIVHSEMRKPSKLLENVAFRILNQIKSTFPSVSHIKIEITKTNPPMEGEMKGVSIVLEQNFPS